MPTEKPELTRAVSPAISPMNVKVAELVKELVRDLDPLDLVEGRKNSPVSVYSDVSRSFPLR